MNKSKSVLKWAAHSFILGAVIVVEPAFSKQCLNNVAKTSTYFVPHVKNYCPTPKPCDKFKKVVKMQGSGTLSGGKVLKYTGKVQNIGNCDTALGAAGKCLIPFVSIAADPKHYQMGDIIQMPSMKGQSIKLPNGKTMVHPGFFIVQDTGGAIKGKNRFDFFTGAFGFTHKDNAFGAKGGETNLSDKKGCEDRKQFGVIRRGSPNYEYSLASIENAVNGMSATRMVASVSNSYIDRGSR